MDTLAPAPPPSPRPALAYQAGGGAAAWPPETKAIVLAAAAVSVSGLATSAYVLWMWLEPAAFKRGGVAPWPVLSFSTFQIAARLLFDAIVVAGAAAAVARLRGARAMLLGGAAGLVVLAVVAQVNNSFFFEPTKLSRNKGGPDLISEVISHLGWLLNTVVVRLLLIYALTRPHAKAAAARGD